MIVLLAVLIAQTNPILNNLAPGTGSNGSPVAVNGCSFIYRTEDFVRQVSRIRIEFTSRSSKPIDLVTFNIKSDLGDAVIRDVGTYDPGSETKHELPSPYSNGTMMNSTNQNLRCQVQAVHFKDGTVWQSGGTGAPSESMGNRLGLALELRAEGVFVKLVGAGSPAAAAGFHQGDRIVSVGSNAISGIGDLNAVFEMSQPGVTIPIVIERSGTAITLTLKVVSQPP